MPELLFEADKAAKINRTRGKYEKGPAIIRKVKMD